LGILIPKGRELGRMAVNYFGDDALALLGRAQKR